LNPDIDFVRPRKTLRHIEVISSMNEPEFQVINSISF